VKFYKRWNMVSRIRSTDLRLLWKRLPSLFKCLGRYSIKVARLLRIFPLVPLGGLVGSIVGILLEDIVWGLLSGIGLGVLWGALLALLQRLSGARSEKR
jgi:hypothetical protein